MRSSSSSSSVANQQRSLEEKVYEVVLKQAALVKEQRISRKEKKALELSGPIEKDGTTYWDLLNEAYDHCGEVCAEHAKTFYLETTCLAPTKNGGKENEKRVLNQKADTSLRHV